MEMLNEDVHCITTLLGRALLVKICVVEKYNKNFLFCVHMESLLKIAYKHSLI